jgi:Tfp pilus assembly protein PilO
MDWKNIKLEDIKLDDIKNKLLALADKKTLIKFSIGFGSIILFLIIYYAILNPIVKNKQVKIDDMINKKNETVQFKQEIKKAKKKIKELTPKYEKHSTLFHSKKEVEDLYDSLSTYAEANGLVIATIEKKDPVPVYKGKSAKKKKKDKNKSNIAYYKIPVVYQVQGNFLSYLKFKRQLSKSKKMLNFDKESIKVLKGDSTGAINATGTLTIVGLTDEFS